MGAYFVMSFRFDKSIASDFGLVPINESTAIDPKDGSIWLKTELFDFGWGKENGFYKAPLPCFKKLFDIALNGDERDDVYGSAAIILDRFPYELLCKCEQLMNGKLNKKEMIRLIDLFDLEKPINRCASVHKAYEQVKNDYDRWKRIAEIANAYPVLP